MTRLLMLFGYTEYQAQCVAPLLWFLLVAALFVGAASLIFAILEDGGQSNEN